MSSEYPDQLKSTTNAYIGIRLIGAIRKKDTTNRQHNRRQKHENEKSFYVFLQCLFSKQKQNL